MDALGSYIGGNIGAVLAGALGIETGPFALPISVLGRLAGAYIGSTIEDYISLANSIADADDNVVVSSTPTNDPDSFEPFRNGYRRCKKDKSIWDKDNSSHGGEQWKRWKNVHDLENNYRKHNSIWAKSGRIRK